MQFPDGTARTLLNNQSVPGGVLQTVSGRIGNPLGERRLILDAVAGTEMAHAECAYTARSTPPGPLTATLTTDRGCGPGAVYLFAETSVIRYSVSRAALVTLRLEFPDGTSRTLLSNQAVPAGRVQTLPGPVGDPFGERRLVLDAVAGTETAHVECTYTGRGSTDNGPLILTLTTDRGCGGQYRVNDDMLITVTATADTNLTLFVQRADGTQSVVFSHVPFRAGETRTIESFVGVVPGRHLIILRPTALLPPGQVICEFNVVR